MKVKVLITIIILLILSLFIGIAHIDPGVCNGPYKQRALLVTITKPFFAGYWKVFLGFGNKHWDYQKEKDTSRYMECRDKKTGDLFMSYKADNEHFNMDCVWVRRDYINESGCAYWYDKDYYMEGNFIDLTPWSKRIKD